MSEAELVEVVDVGDAKIHGGDEDDVAGGDFGEEMQGDDDGSEHDFLGDGAGDIVSPTHPAAEGFGDSAATDPVSPFAFDDASFKEGTQE